MKNTSEAWYNYKQQHGYTGTRHVKLFIFYKVELPVCDLQPFSYSHISSLTYADLSLERRRVQFGP